MRNMVHNCVRSLHTTFPPSFTRPIGYWCENKFLAWQLQIKYTDYFSLNYKSGPEYLSSTITLVTDACS